MRAWLVQHNANQLLSYYTRHHPGSVVDGVGKPNVKQEADTLIKT
jgi:hypothetical protein